MADNTYLAHHGILGMKWGVRRYQNPDGTLTEAGKRRINASRNSARRAEQAAKVSKHAAGYASQFASAKKNLEKRLTVKNMSDDELKKTNARSAIEQQYLKNNGIKTGTDSPRRSAVEDLFQGLGDAASAVSKKYDRIAEGETARKAKTMSEAELRSAVQRMQLEDQYRQLSKKDRDSGANYVYSHRRETFNDIVTYATPVATAIIVAAINKKIGG